MATKLSIAAGTGWVIGSGINELIETYDPELDDKIGGTIDGALTNISDARSSLQQGKYEEALDKVFGGSITDEGDKTGDYSGDYDVSESYDRYNEWDDKCDPRIEDCR